MSDTAPAVDEAFERMGAATEFTTAAAAAWLARRSAG